MMAVIHPTTEFARAARLRTTRLRYRKALAFALFLLSLFGARAFADEKSFALSSFAPLKIQTALGFYFVTYEAARLNALSTSTNVSLTLEPAGSALVSIRPFESL